MPIMAAIALAFSISATAAAVAISPAANPELAKLTAAECAKAKKAAPRRVYCDDASVAVKSKPSELVAAQPPKPAVPANKIATAGPLADAEKHARNGTTFTPEVQAIPALLLKLPQLAGHSITTPQRALINPLPLAESARTSLPANLIVGLVTPPTDTANLAAPAPVKLVQKNVEANTAIYISTGAAANLLPAAPPSTPPTLPTPPKPPAAVRPQIAFEAAQLVIYWSHAGDAAIGKVVLAREFKLNLLSENMLPNLGGVIATFKVASQREAERVKTLLSARYPTWRIDFHARYLPHQSNAPISNLQRVKPRHFLAEKINYLTPALNAGAGIRVGIVDTAVELNAALSATTLVQRSFLGVGEIPASMAHGTALAALIAGHDAANEFIGLSPSAVLYVASIMRLQGGGLSGSAGGSSNAGASSNTATLVRALDWLLGERVQIVNLSLGGAGDRVMEEVIARLLRANVVVVSAVGNQGEDAAPSYPAAYPGVVAVTASDANDRIYTQANRGAYVAVTAPGVDVWTPDNHGGHYVTGTSFAAAIVSGAVAVMLWRDAGLDASSIRQRLCQHARDLSGGASTASATFGCGLIQLQPTLVALPKRVAAAGGAS